MLLHLSPTPQIDQSVASRNHLSIVSASGLPESRLLYSPKRRPVPLAGSGLPHEGPRIRQGSPHSATSASRLSSGSPEATKCPPQRPLESLTLHIPKSSL